MPVTAIRSVEDAEAFIASMRQFARDHAAAWKQDMQLRPCPFCGQDVPEPAEPFTDSFEVSRCRSCRSLYVNPVPTHEQLRFFYRQAEPIRILNRIYANRVGRSSGFVNDTRMQQVMEYLACSRSDASRNPSALEIGCNTGQFLDSLATTAASRGLQFERLVGIDIDDSVLPASGSTEAEFRLMDVHQAASCPEFQSAFDLIFHFELIEHLPDPAAFMRAAATLLRPGGYMVFTTPNAVGMEMELAGYNDYRLMSHGIFPPMHLNAFSTFNMALFAVRSGFFLISMETPGKLDVDCAVRYRQKSDAMEPVFEALADHDQDTLGMIQALVARLRASSTLLVVLQRPFYGPESPNFPD